MVTVILSLHNRLNERRLSGSLRGGLSVRNEGALPPAGGLIAGRPLTTPLRTSCTRVSQCDDAISAIRDHCLARHVDSGAVAYPAFESTDVLVTGDLGSSDKPQGSRHIWSRSPLRFQLLGQVRNQYGFFDQRQSGRRKFSGDQLLSCDEKSGNSSLVEPCCGVWPRTAVGEVDADAVGIIGNGRFGEWRACAPNDNSAGASVGYSRPRLTPKPPLAGVAFPPTITFLI